MWIAIIAGVVVAGMGGLLMHLSRLRQVQHHVFRCPECGQKIRFAASRAGAEGACPRCRKKVMLPLTPQTLDRRKPTYRIHGPIPGRLQRPVRSRR